ncbi:hypothetical protein [Sporocytophaga myxococcoides]|uniref:hypothetical protein n=1 Tax=Sporocytophaga myxococcoides TaxID=153721 RepID=UPI000426CEEA|nr:hypothetical protein [Sporocytophaga myxococcoides]
MKKIFKSSFLLLFSLSSQFAFSQWSTNSNDIYNTNYSLSPAGKVGIGLIPVQNSGINKTSVLQIKGISGNNITGGYEPSPIVSISSDGQTSKLNIGIGSGTYGSFIYANSVLKFISPEINIIDGYSTSTLAKLGVSISPVAGSYNFGTYTGYFLTGLSVGTSNTIPSGYKLAVDGKIICEEIDVKMSEDWPDYVFDKTYNLRPLDSLKLFVESERHLPEIPSAKEVENNGISLAEMSRLQMAKIEELTLYLFQLKEKNDELEKKNEALEKLYLELKKKIN